MLTFEALRGDRSFGQRTEDWIRDSLFVRGCAIRLRNDIEFTLFSTSDQVIVGRAGWLMDKPTSLQRAGLDRMSINEWSHLFSRVLRLEAILHSRGCRLVILPIPLKDTVYPDQFPSPTFCRETPEGFARFRSWLQNGGREIPSVDVLETMRRHAPQHDTFYRTDIHWNEFGAAVVAREIVNLIGKMERCGNAWRGDIVCRTGKRFVGGDAQLLAPLWSNPGEYPPQLQDDCRTQVTSESLDLGDGVVVRLFRGGGCGELPKTVLVGNSFSILLTDVVPMPDHFRELIRFHDLSYFPKLIRTLPPDTKYLVWQFFETQIPCQLNSDLWWKQVDESNEGQASE